MKRSCIIIALATGACVLAVLLASCGSDPAGPQAVVGSDTMVCEVNGVRWVAGSRIMAASPLAHVLTRDGGRMVLLGYRWTMYEPLIDEEIRLHASSVTGPGAFPLDSALFIDRRTNRSYTSAPRRDTVHVTHFDTLSHRIAGTFSFTATNSSGDAVDVAKGRFDITLSH